jgi:opacity protein-like surface antigen
MNTGKWTLVILTVLLISGLGTAEALTGLGFGVRAGTTKLEDPNTGESFDAMAMFGGHLKIGTLPIIDLEASAEYAQKKYDIGISIPQADDFSGEVTFRIVSLNASAKYSISPPLSPIKPYVGAGLGMHLMTSTIDLPGTQYTIPLNEDYSESKTGAHALGGVLLTFPVIPFEIFAEGRYGVIFTEDESVKATSLYAGLNFKL